MSEAFSQEYGGEQYALMLWGFVPGARAMTVYVPPSTGSARFHSTGGKLSSSRRISSPSILLLSGTLIVSLETCGRREGQVGITHAGPIAGRRFGGGIPQSVHRASERSLVDRQSS